MIEYIVVAAYAFSLLLIFLFSLGQLNLAWHYLRKRLKEKRQPAAPQPLPATLPRVTVQLPIFNEKYVVERLIDCIMAFDYPKELLEVQVLDDSTDETKAIVTNKVAQWQQQGYDIQQVLRPNRKGFKAGALQYGLDKAKGEYIAIFDADFLPQPDFLKQTLPHFADSQVGVVQTRWGHLNKEYSMLTKLQAFGLDAHFSVEQSGRSHAGSFINFNGTAGIWRRICITDAGGWSADTLTEDLDLSYRAQMKGWRFQFLEDVVSPAELPVIMPAIKSQQYRWNKGAAETARKNIGKVMASPLALRTKLHAVMHLFNSSIFICLFLAAILSIPMLYIKAGNPRYEVFFNLGSIFLIGFFSIGFFYWIASRRIVPKATLPYFIRTFPVFLTVSMGLALHNAWAVSEGLLGFKSPFIRTPKFNIKSKKDRWQGNQYIRPKVSVLTVLEGLLFLYFTFGIVTGFVLADYGLLFFHVMLALGFALVFYHSLKPIGKHG